MCVCVIRRFGALCSARSVTYGGVEGEAKARVQSENATHSRHESGGILEPDKLSQCFEKEICPSTIIGSTFFANEEVGLRVYNKDT